MKRLRFRRQIASTKIAGKTLASPAMTPDHALALGRAEKCDRVSVTTVLRKLCQTPAYLTATAEEKARLQEEARKAETQRRIAKGIHASVKFPQTATEGEVSPPNKRLRTQEESARMALYNSLDVPPQCKKEVYQALFNLRRTTPWTHATPSARIRMNEEAAARAVQKWSATHNKSQPTKDPESSSGGSSHANACGTPTQTLPLKAPQTTSTRKPTSNLLLLRHPPAPPHPSRRTNFTPPTPEPPLPAKPAQSPKSRHWSHPRLQDAG